MPRHSQRLLATLLCCLLAPAAQSQELTASAKALWEDVMDTLQAHYYQPVDEVALTLATLRGVAKKRQTDLKLPVPPPAEPSAARDFFVREITRIAALPGQRTSPEQATLQAIDYLCEEQLKFSFLITEQATEAQQYIRTVAPADVGMTNYREADRILCKPIEGSPAWQMGIRHGDELLSINGVPARGQPLWKVGRDRHGTEGSICTLSVQQAREPRRILTSKITRQLISPVPTTAERELTGVRVRLPSFAAEHDATVRSVLSQALQQLQPKEILTLDLRGNPGGSTETAVELLSALLPGPRPLTIAQRHIRGPLSQQFPADISVTTPRTTEVSRIVVLVDAQTASTAELVVQALLESPELKVTVGGEKTFGKHLVQNSLTLPRRPSISLMIPYGYMSTAKGTTWEKGIQPTFGR